MTDFVGDRECVTHHMCDCTTARLDGLEVERDALRAALERFMEATAPNLTLSPQPGTTRTAASHDRITRIKAARELALGVLREVEQGSPGPAERAERTQEVPVPSPQNSDPAAVPAVPDPLSVDCPTCGSKGRPTFERCRAYGYRFRPPHPERVAVAREALDTGTGEGDSV